MYKPGKWAECAMFIQWMCQCFIDMFPKIFHSCTNPKHRHNQASFRAGTLVTLIMFSKLQPESELLCKLCTNIFHIIGQSNYSQ